MLILPVVRDANTNTDADDDNPPMDASTAHLGPGCPHADGSVG
jgi:hypothetical protein